MLRRSVRRRVAFTVGALAFAAAGSLPYAQLAAQAKPLVTAKDLGQWESLGASRLSPNGAWLSYTISRGNEENELRVRGGVRDTTIVIPYGTAAAFSADSRWLAALVGVPPKERDKLLKDRKPVRTSFTLRDLNSGAVITIAEVNAFSFGPAGGFVSVTKYPAEGKRNSEVQLLDLANGTRFVFNNVSEQLWNDRKPWLAMTIATEGATGNGVEVFDGVSGAVRMLDNSANMYRALSWRPKSDELAVLRSTVDKAFTDTSHVLLQWTTIGANAAPMRVLDPATSADFPAKMRVSEFRKPSWSRDGKTVYVGLRAREAAADAPKKSDEKISDVEIWHTNDVHVIPEQSSAEQRDLRASMLAAWRLDDSRVVPLGSDVAESASVLEGDAFAMETDRKPYAFGQKFGRRDQDVWTINVSTGARTKVLTKVRSVFAPDPTGARIPWFDGRDYWAVEVATGRQTNLTAALRARGADFVDHEDDHPSDVLPSIGNPLWSKDGKTLLVYSAYDVWALAMDGSGGKRLTDGARDGLEYRVVSFAGFGATPAERAIDLGAPVYLSLYGKRDKRSGYARLMPAGAMQRLVLADAAIGSLTRADSADRYAYVQQRFDESPNVYAASADLANPTRLTETNPFQKNYAWGKAELMNYTSTIGVPLQAILYYPANYDPKKKYPMIVYTYELLSQGYHRYIVPRENDYYNANVFTQNGYFVLMPDIVFRPREPGIAVLQSVEPAVRRVIARGLVDGANVGHAGHSQGGYEAYYLATHSTLFKTAVAGAGISDMWSFAGQMHWSSVPEFDHWETGQFRMQVPPWEDVQAMNRNSPINRVHVMPAKSVLIEIGGDDPTVDMRQGVEFYNYARRAGKDAVMLLYPGEGHGLGKRENAIDYERRILQWFAYYLKGEAPAKWITEGQSWLARKALLDANK